MPVYIGIDETGSFDIRGKSKSFIGGIITRKGKNEIANVFRETLKHLNISVDKPLKDYFHYRKWFNGKLGFDAQTANEGLAFLCDRLVEKEIITAVFKTYDRPVMLANAQHWWLLSLQSALDGLFSQKRELFSPGERIEIYADSRHKKVTGMPRGEQALMSNNEYHALLKDKINKFFSSRYSLHNASFRFESDTENVHVALADMIIGIMKNRSSYLGNSTVFRFPCTRTASPPPSVLFDEEKYEEVVRIAVASTIEGREEISHEQFKTALKAIRTADPERHQLLWDEILSEMQFVLDSRDTDSDRLFRLEPLFDMLNATFDAKWEDQGFKSKTCIRLARIKLTYDTHRGSTSAQSADEYFSVFESAPYAFGKISERWEAYVEAKAAAAQIFFNAYDFASVQGDFDSLYAAHSGIKECVGKLICSETDETIAAITGTLGQAYAFEGRYDDAELYLKEDYEHTNPGTLYRSMVNSYLVTLYILKNDPDSAGYYLKEKFEAEKIPFSNLGEGLFFVQNNWTLVDTLRYRSLLAENGEKQRAPVDEEIKRVNSGYPYPLVLKWTAYLCHCDGEDERAETLLTQAITMLESPSNQFAIRTLAVPLHLMRADICPQKIGTYNKKYRLSMDNLLTGPETFKEYICGKPASGYDDNQKDFDLSRSAGTLWEKATVLPFYYS